MKYQLWKWTGLYGYKKSISWYLYYKDVWYYWHEWSGYDNYEGWKRAYPGQIVEGPTDIPSSSLDFLIQTGKDFYKTLEGLE